MFCLEIVGLKKDHEGQNLIGEGLKKDHEGQNLIGEGLWIVLSIYKRKLFLN